MNGIEEKDRKTFIALFIAFLFTEIIDDLLDHVFNISWLHSLIQFLIFVLLFFTVLKLFILYKKQIKNSLIPDYLMDIIEIIDSEKNRGMLVNQTKLIKLLNVTKPTIKKRLEQLNRLGYIYFEVRGKNKYIKLSQLAEKLVQ